MKNKKGFTLVELLAVIVVLAIVMLVVADRVGDAMLKSRGNALALQIKSISREVEKIGAMENQISTDQIIKIVSSGDLTYLGFVKSGSKIDDKIIDNDVIVVQAKKGSKFSNVSFTKDIEDLDTLAISFDGSNIVKGNASLKDNKSWLREPIIYFETTVPIIVLTPFEIGKEFSLGSNKYNVIKDNGEDVVALDQNCIDNNISFSNTNYWVSNGKLKSIYGNKYNANVYDENSLIKLDNYYNNLKQYNVSSVRLITYDELINLGCSSTNNTCDNTYEFIKNGDDFWTGTAGGEEDIWMVAYDGGFSLSKYNSSYKVRPVIIINKKYIK